MINLVDVNDIVTWYPDMIHFNCHKHSKYEIDNIDNCKEENENLIDSLIEVQQTTEAVTLPVTDGSNEEL